MATHSSFLARDGGSLVGSCLWDRTELDTTEVTQQQQQYLSKAEKNKKTHVIKPGSMHKASPAHLIVIIPPRNKHLVYGAVSLIVRIHGSRNQGVKIQVASLIFTPSDLQQGFHFFPQPMIYWPRRLSTKVVNVSTCLDSLELEVKTSTWSL